MPVSCKLNQLGAQHCQYILPTLFITSTCYGPIQASCLVCRIDPAHQTANYTE